MDGNNGATTRVFFTHSVNQDFDGDLDPLPCLVLANGTWGFINVRDGDGGELMMNIGMDLYRSFGGTYEEGGKNL